MTTVDALRAVESLRSGVPSRKVAARYPFGRQRLLDAINDDFAALERGEARGRLRLVCAQYGDGKSHALQAIWNVAEQREWTVSFISLSSETKLSSMGQIYRKLVQNTYTPRTDQPGIKRMIERHRSSAPEALHSFAEERLHSRLRLVVQNILYGGNPHLVPIFQSDVEGEFAKISDLRKWSDRAAGIAPPKFEPFREERDVIHYYRLVDYLSSHVMGNGWLILLDELEMLRGLGKKSRMQAYANLLQLATDPDLAHTYIVTALAQSYVDEVQIDDPARIADLRAAGNTELADQAGRASDFLRAEERSARLPRLERADLIAALANVIEDHAQAYEWQPSTSPEQLYDFIDKRLPPDRQLRNVIRGAIYWLDITLQYGHPPTDFAVGAALQQRSNEEDDEPDEPTLLGDLPGTGRARTRRRNLLTGEID